MNERFLHALTGKNKERPPVWIMRQAGRYLPEYQSLRKKHSFLELCHTPDLIEEVTSMPLKRFPFDAAILFSDILIVPENMGMDLHFEDSLGPVFTNPIRTKEDISRLKECPPLPYVEEGIKNLKKSLKVPLIGFAGAPFTVASYMIEGQSRARLKETKKFLTDEAVFTSLLDKILESTITHLKMQVRAGVNALQIFDTWASHLSFEQFHKFSLPYLQKIVETFKDTVPVILFSKASSAFSHSLESVKPRAISFDIQSSLKQIRKQFPGLVIQGNMDPEILFSEKNTVIRETKKILEEMKNDPGYIFNLGHGILPDTPLESVYTLMETIELGS